MTMQRYDTVSFHATKTEEGFIRDAPIVGRSGVMRYKNTDGSDRFEYRPPEEAFNEDSLKTLQGKPITLGHKAMVTADNAGYVQPIGTVLSDGRQDGNTIRADIVIHNLPTSARELSCGYNLDLDETPGTTPDGQHYDAVQRNIRYNHVAVVPKGRAGIARLNMDGDQEIITETGGKKMPENMTKIRVDSGIEYDAAQEVSVYVQKLLDEKKDATSKLDSLQAKYDTAIADLNKVKKDHEEAEAAHKNQFDAAVKARMDILEVAKRHDIKDVDKLSNMDIKKAVITAVRGDAIDLTDKSDDYVNAAFDMAKDGKQAHNDALKRQLDATHKQMGNNGEKVNLDDDPQAALEKLEAEEAAMWEKEVK